jgi:hypothetical protein
MAVEMKAKLIDGGKLVVVDVQGLPEIVDTITVNVRAEGVVFSHATLNRSVAHNIPREILQQAMAVALEAVKRGDTTNWTALDRAHELERELREMADRSRLEIERLQGMVNKLIAQIYVEQSGSRS